MTKLMPTVYFWISLFLLIGAHFLFPDLIYLSGPFRYLGLVLIGFGIGLNIWTDRLFKRYETAVKPHLNPSKLIDHGPFTLSRHPMYLGMSTVLLGTSVLLGTLQTLVFPILFAVVMDRFFLPMEEQNLQSTFGERYQAYKGRVRRWI